MARLELAKNVWWAKMSYDEQVDYLKGHPRSKLKLTRRRSRKNKSAEEEVQPEQEVEEQPAEQTDAVPSGDTAPSGAEDIPVGGDPVPEDVPAGATPEEQQEVLDAVVNNGDTVELTEEEKNAGAEVLAKEIAPAFEKENLDEKFGEDDKADFEDELEDILADDDEENRTARFLGTALRFAVKAGIITAAIALTGGSPTVLFVPSVMQSIWSTATDWSERSGSLFDTAADAVHKTFKSGAQLHLKYGARKPKGGK